MSRVLYEVVGWTEGIEWRVECQWAAPRLADSETTEPRFEWWLVAPGPMRLLYGVPEWDRVWNEDFWRVRLSVAVARALGSSGVVGDQR
jgi:hypothetical protein